jgi:hypothetical protein
MRYPAYKYPAVRLEEQRANDCMLPLIDVTVASKRTAGQRWRWRGPTRCSICRRVIWLHSMDFREPLGAPEPLRAWVLCGPCHEALLVEMRRSSLHSPVRLRIAMGFVAAERSPGASHLDSRERERRELTWFVRLLVLFALLHLVILVILLLAPK